MGERRCLREAFFNFRDDQCRATQNEADCEFPGTKILVTLYSRRMFTLHNFFYAKVSKIESLKSAQSIWRK